MIYMEVHPRDVLFISITADITRHQLCESNKDTPGGLLLFTMSVETSAAYPNRIESKYRGS